MDSPGNVTPMAEFNFRADPDAADIVLGTSKGFQATPKGYHDRLNLVTEGKQAPIHVVILPLKGKNWLDFYGEVWVRRFCLWPHRRGMTAQTNRGNLVVFIDTNQ